MDTLVESEFTHDIEREHLRNRIDNSVDDPRFADTFDGIRAVTPQRVSEEVWMRTVLGIAAIDPAHYYPKGDEEKYKRDRATVMLATGFKEEAGWVSRKEFKLLNSTAKMLRDKVKTVDEAGRKRTGWDPTASLRRHESNVRAAASRR